MAHQQSKLKRTHRRDDDLDTALAPAPVEPLLLGVVDVGVVDARLEAVLSETGRYLFGILRAAEKGGQLTHSGREQAACTFLLSV